MAGIDHDQQALERRRRCAPERRWSLDRKLDVVAIPIGVIAPERALPQCNLEQRNTAAQLVPAHRAYVAAVVAVPYEIGGSGSAVYAHPQRWTVHRLIDSKWHAPGQMNVDGAGP